MAKANWAGRLKARVKVHNAKKARKKAYKKLAEAEARESKKKGKDTQRTKDVTSQLKQSGLSQAEIDKLRGKK